MEMTNGERNITMLKVARVNGARAMGVKIVTKIGKEVGTKKTFTVERVKGRRAKNSVRVARAKRVRAKNT